MNYHRIHKSAHRKTPNLLDYEKCYANFTWEKAKKDLSATTNGSKRAEISYFEKGKINISHNALDKWKGTTTEKKIAMIWEGQYDYQSRTFTYGQLIAATNQFANILTSLDVVKGDRVFTFLPRIPELYISFLGSLKTGAIGGNLFAAFGKEALQDRLSNSEAKVLVTSPELEPRINEIRDQLPHLKHILVVGENFDELMSKASKEFETIHLDEDAASYILYTSGTTGKPKGVTHTHGDIIQQHLSGKWILDMHPDDIYWCTADPGWVTGVVYGTISPWSNGMTQLIHGGHFDPDTWYDLIEKHQVNIWYTAPTAIRMLMTNDKILRNHDLSSLRYIASVGEPLNPEAIIWSGKHLGLPIHDNYWQTETGAIVIANYPSMDIKPGSMGRPFPGIIAGILDQEGQELGPGQEGDLALKVEIIKQDKKGSHKNGEQPLLRGWPSMMKGIWENEEKYNSYFQGEWYLTGDRASRDEEGYFWFIGRADDVIKTAGERIGPFEVESALMKHHAIAEAGVIGKPDKIRGEIIKAFIKLKPGQEESDELIEEIQQFMKKELAGHAYPREIEFRKKLPKTRSGKIMRRVLKMEELGKNLGDTSTMEEY